MKVASRNFLITISIVTLLCIMFQLIWNSKAPENYVISNGFILLGMFVATVSLIHLFLIKASQGKAQEFIRKYLASTVLKFMFYVLVLIVLLLFSSDNKTAIILHFLFYYALFTVLEVSFLYRELQQLKNT